MDTSSDSLHRAPKRNHPDHSDTDLDPEDAPIPTSETALGGDCIETPPEVPKPIAGFVPTFTRPGDLRGIQQSGSRYLATYFAYTPPQYKWVWTKAGNDVKSREQVVEMLRSFPSRKIKRDDVMIFKKANPERLGPIPSATDLMALYLVGATPGKGYTTQNLNMVVENRLKAWAGILKTDTPTITPGIINHEDALRSTRFVRRHRALCVYTAWAHSKTGGCPDMDGMVATLCDQVSMLNSWCELRTAALTYKMITEGKIVGIYDARIFPLVKRFMGLWKDCSSYWGDWMKYVGLIWPEDADVFHGRDWDPLYCLAAEYAKLSSNNQMANFQYKHALPESLVQSLLTTLKGGSSVSLVPIEEIQAANLPIPPDYNSLRAGPEQTLSIEALLRTLSALPSSSKPL